MNDDEFGLGETSYPAKPKKKLSERKFARLEDVLFAGLPQFRTEYNGESILDVKALARAINISFQALYKWFERDKISGKRAGQIITLSESNKIAGFTAVTRDDFWEFMSH